MIMTTAIDEKESSELEKLLADVQRTIRENDKFIRHLKEDDVDVDEEGSPDMGTDDGGYEEL